MDYDYALVIILCACCGIIMGNTLSVYNSIGVSVRSWRWWLGAIDLWTIVGGAFTVAMHSLLVEQVVVTPGTWLLVVGLAGWGVLNHFGVFQRTVMPIK